MKSNKLGLIAFSALVFLLSLAANYFPLFYRGYSYSFEVDNLILARNLSLAEKYSLDDNKNVILNSSRIAVEGIESKFGNKLTPVFYGYLFKFFGFHNSLPVWASLILFSLVNVILFLIVVFLFNLKAGLIFAFLEIVSPLVLQNSIRFGTYEWAAFFLAFATLFYLIRKKANWPILLVVGALCALASLARNSFVISLVPFVIFDGWTYRSWKRLAFLLIPFILVWGLYLGGGWLRSGELKNSYLSSNETTSAYMHIFPDSYTWNYERDEFVAKNFSQGAINYDVSEFLLLYGYDVSLRNQVKMYLSSAISYPRGLLAQITLGGALMIFFMGLGSAELFRRNIDLFRFVFLWTGSWYLFLIIMKSNHWGHFIMLEFPLFLLATLGIYRTIEFIQEQKFSQWAKYALTGGILLTIGLQLIESDKFMFHEKYLYARQEEPLKLVSKIASDAGLLDKTRDVVALGLSNPACSLVNYYNDVNCIYFAPATIKKLAQQNKLQWAFDQYGVTKVYGYETNLIREILAKAKVDEL